MEVGVSSTFSSVALDLNEAAPDAAASQQEAQEQGSATGSGSVTSASTQIESAALSASIARQTQHATHGGKEAANSAQTAAHANDAETVPQQQESQKVQGEDTATASKNHETVTIKRADGSIEIREGGSAAWRNNNPGNMINGAGDYTPIGRNGANTGKDFVIFANEEDGFNAMVANLKTPKYQVLDIGKAIATWAPAVAGNDPDVYADHVKKWTGIASDTKMNSLTATQLTTVANAIKRQEGWRVGKVAIKTGTSTPENPNPTASSGQLNSIPTGGSQQSK